MKPARNLAFQSGISLVVSLLMLAAVLILGTSAANIALQAEKASRNDRDHQVALQAAEAALADAELDIEESPDTGRSRSSIFAKSKMEGFAPGCGAGMANPFLGLCLGAEDGVVPVWQAIDFADDSSHARTVPYGHFTGMAFQTGHGVLPAKLPRYIIELLPYTREGQGAGANDMSYFYRITAVGFGMRPSTLVVLQTYYRKEG